MLCGEAENTMEADSGSSQKNLYGVYICGLVLQKTMTIQNVNDKISECHNYILEKLAVQRAARANLAVTQKALATAIGKSERITERRITALQEKGYRSLFLSGKMLGVIRIDAKP